MVGTTFDRLQKPPPDDDPNGWKRWYYKVCELLNGGWWKGPFKVGTLPVYPDDAGVDYTEFEADGTMVAHGAATTWNDINISLVPPAGGAAAPAVIAVNGDAWLDCYAFSGTNATPDIVHSSLEVLHDYKEGSDIVFHVHWAPVTAGVGDVKWHLRYAWFNAGGTPTGASLYVTTATSGVAWTEQTSAITISGAGKLMGSRFIFALIRDATDPDDTYNAQAATFDMGIHYEKDTLGSRQITTK